MLADNSVLICTLPRSGSWLLAEALEDTGLCGQPREYFRPDYQEIYLRAWGNPSVSTYTEYVAQAISTRTANGTFSAKIHWGQFTHLVRQLRHNDLYADLNDAELVCKVFPNPTYIYLTRTDKARQAVSLYKAIHMDVWWQFEGDAEERSAFFTQEPDLSEINEIESTLIAHESCWRKYFARNNIRVLTITYEEMAERYEATIVKVLRFLDIPVAPSGIKSPRLKKQANLMSEEWVRKFLSSDIRQKRVAHDQQLLAGDDCSR